MSERWPGSRKKFRIDISKHEFCASKRARELEGCTVYVYSPEMMLFEKLRAICQQMPEYLHTVRDSAGGSARARDFFDIYSICKRFRMDLSNAEQGVLMREIFRAKRVPLTLVGSIQEYREYHRQDFASLQATVAIGTELRDFDFYFDFVLQICRDYLKPFWDV